MSFYFTLPQKVVSSKTAYDCAKCGLLDKVNPPIDPEIGDNYNGLVIIGQNPTKEEMGRRVPLTNAKCHVIRGLALKKKINIAKQATTLHAMRCFKNNPSDTSFRCCRPFMVDTLTTLKPKLIITLGSETFKSVMNLKNKYAPSAIRNRVVPNYEFNCLVFPVFNPNDLSSGHYEAALRNDLNRAFDLWNAQFNKRKIVNQILADRKILKDISIIEIKTIRQAIEAFEMIEQLTMVALDYEATNLNPYDDFFEITHITFSIARTAWVFHESLWIENEDSWTIIKQWMVKILTNGSIKKIIQNSKFEDLSSRFVFGIKKIVNVECTMLATHVVDERRGCTGLDFQNLVRFGIPPYSETIKSFLKKKNKDDKTNNIRKAPHDDLIQYAGLDGITTFHNWRVLSEILLPNAYPQAIANYKFLLKGHWVFANMSQRGIPIGQAEFDEIDITLDEKIEEIAHKITTIPEIIQYNDYLLQRTTNKKAGDKILKQLIESRKENTNANGTEQGTDNEPVSKSKHLRRKVSFN